jgi:4-amino-4-deoxy-L-arabinose transferase-like glycosyltransferase
MTLTAPLSVADPPIAAAPRRIPGHHVAFGGLLTLTGALYLWGLAASGWANSYYSAAVQASSQSWTAFLFGSTDAGNAITVDKTPGALWVMDASVRLFGFNSWSVLAPQALEGVAAVALLYAAVRRINGPAAGLLAGAVLALTPVATLMFRFNNPDALLILLLVTGAYCVQRACEEHSARWWLPLAGVALGFAFLAKMAQAFLVGPGFALAYLLTAAAPLTTRVKAMIAAGAAMVVSGGWYLVLVALWPVDKRPFIGGSAHNSVVELALGYNGFGRLTGDEPGGLGNTNYDVGWGRLFDRGMGADIAWLIPAAVICIVAALLITRYAPRTNAIRGAGVLWGGWLLVTAMVISYSNGIIHPYYTVALAPAVAAGIGVGAPLLWRRRADIRAATAMSGAVLVTTTLSCVLLARTETWLGWLRPAIAVAGMGAAALLMAAGRGPDVVGRAGAVVAVVACLGGPTAFSVATAMTPHHGVIPSVGPAGAGGLGFGNFLDPPDPSPALVAALRVDAGQYTWTAATIGTSNAAGYQLASGTSVMAVGGFNGTDPAPTLAMFQQLVANNTIHYFIDAPMGGSMHAKPDSSRQAADIVAWVQQHFPARTIDDLTVYTLFSPTG